MPMKKALREKLCFFQNVRPNSVAETLGKVTRKEVFLRSCRPITEIISVYVGAMNGRGHCSSKEVDDNLK